MAPSTTPATATCHDTILDLLRDLPAGQVRIWLARCADETRATRTAGVLPLPASSFDTVHQALTARGISADRASQYLDRYADEIEAEEHAA